MTGRSLVKLVREGELVAEVAVEILEVDGGWARYLSVEDACRLDDVRDALRARDLHRASQLAVGLYRLTPIQESSRHEDATTKRE